MKQDFAAFINQDAPGAMPRGTPVVKIRTEMGDVNPVGSRGKVLGSIGKDASILYFVEWETLPGVPVLVTDYKISSGVHDQLSTICKFR